MALEIYKWSDISGKVMIEQNGHQFELNLYGDDKCNCFLATVYEYEGDDGKTYEQLQWFFMDESHGKRMLGLVKSYDGTKENCLTDVKKIILYKNKCANWKKILTMFAQAFDQLTIEIKEVG